MSVMYPIMAAPNRLVVFFVVFLSLLSLFSCQIGLPPPSPVSREMEDEVTKIVKSNMIAIQAKSEKFLREVITKRLSDPETPPYSQICLDQCEENFANAYLDVLRVMDGISRKRYEKASEDVDAIVGDIETCYECVNDIVGEDRELKAFNAWLDGTAEDCLAQFQRLTA